MNVREELHLTSIEDFEAAHARWYDAPDSLTEAELGFEITRNLPDLIGRIRSGREISIQLVDEWRDRPTITRHSHKEQIEGIEDLVSALRSVLAMNLNIQGESK